MIKVETIFSENNRSVRYDTDKKKYVVPVSLTTPGFTLIDQVRAEISLSAGLLVPTF